MQQLKVSQLGARFAQWLSESFSQRHRKILLKRPIVVKRDYFQSILFELVPRVVDSVPQVLVPMTAGPISEQAGMLSLYELKRHERLANWFKLRVQLRKTVH